MKHYILDHAFPVTWKMGQYNRSIIDSIIAQVETRLPSDRNIVFFDTTWGNKEVYQRLMGHQDLDNLISFGLVDPIHTYPNFKYFYGMIRDQSWPDCDTIDDFAALPKDIQQELLSVHGIDLENFNTPFRRFQGRLGRGSVEIGYTAEPLGIRLELHAMLSADSMGGISKQDLSMSRSDIIPWLCYQLKPHPHRYQLAVRAIQEDLLGRGLMTLGKRKSQDGQSIVLLDPHHDDTPTTDEIVGDWIGTHNNLTLGYMPTWQRSFLVVASETTTQSDRYFISEKTWKPVVGMRPFVIHGDPSAYPWLQSLGFDTFEDLWPDINLRDSANYHEHTEKIITIMKRTSGLTDRQLYDLYQTILPRLEHNRDHFLQYAEQQRKKITDINQHLEDFGFFD